MCAIVACVMVAALLTFDPEPARSVPGTPATDGVGGDHRVPTPPVEPEPPAAPAAPLPTTAVPFPHPIITEVLFAVPSGPAGDANRDGARDAAGDEFVELVNPHDRPIQLFGYSLTDSQEPGKGQLKFTFPALELAPGEIVVVFNGFAATIADPVGDQRTPPTGPNSAFAGARVFSIRCSNNKTAFGNAGDHVMLSAPDGTNVQRVWWSEDPASRSAAPAPAVNPAAPPAPSAPRSKPAPKPPIIDDYAPSAARSSVTREGLLATSRFVSHMDFERAPFSPGVYVMVKTPGAPASPPAPSAAVPAAPTPQVEPRP